MESNELAHEGVLERSGRYPWGSGEHPYQRLDDFTATRAKLKKEGLTDKEIYTGMGMSSTEYRQRISNAKAEREQKEYRQIVKLQEQGYSTTEIGRKLGMNESSVRSKLKAAQKSSSKPKTQEIVDHLKQRVKEDKYIDYGAGAEAYLGVSKERLKSAVQKCIEEGYTRHYLQVNQLGTGKKTSVVVLAAPGTTWKEVNANKDKISMPVKGYTETPDGRTLLGIKKPKSISSDRIMVRYAEDGGTKKDGVIELRRGVDDISLGDSRYAQVRVAVDGTHYLKGMAMYSDTMPKGVDVIFNTNKHSDTPKMDVFKKLKDDPDNPFGATIKPTGQREYIDKDGKKQQSVINIVNEEGDWDKWSKTLSSQVLSKQTPELAKKQLNLAFADRADQFAEAKGVTNAAVKEKLLTTFADDCDAAAAHLKAAALPRQRAQVILPIDSLKDTECFAPNYRDGESVVLIRYPHAGTFEIPELRVNNRNKDARSVIGTDAKDAIGINSNVAERLSGADFDGDTVVVIPTRGVKVKTSPQLEGLKNFDPKAAYPNPNKGDEFKTGPDTGFHKQQEMGSVSNLITDMTLGGASLPEICRAVKHSMVVIDAEKHNLDWRQSAIDNGIPELKRKYQGRSDAGAATLISRSKGEVRVPQFDRIDIDPKTGEKVYRYTGETYTDKEGKVKESVSKIKRMDTVKDARELSSGTVMESVYADYANKLKAMANEARKEAVSVDFPDWSPSAKQAYAEEVKSIDSKIAQWKRNKPLERKAQILGNITYQARLDANPNMEKDEMKRLKNQALAAARARVGAKSNKFELSDGEWAAIQAGAVSKTKQREIVQAADLDALKKRAMPREQKGLASTKVARAKAMINSGHTQAEVADALGISVSTLRNYL